MPFGHGSKRKRAGVPRVFAIYQGAMLEFQVVHFLEPQKSINLRKTKNLDLSPDFAT